MLPGPFESFVDRACGVNDTACMLKNSNIFANLNLWRTYKTFPRQNVSIQNVYTHNVSLPKRLRNETSPVTKCLRKKSLLGIFLMFLIDCLKMVAVKSFVFCG
jgi:hypothetical protein